MPFICSFDTLKMPCGWGGCDLPRTRGHRCYQVFPYFEQFQQVKDKLQQELGPTVNCERFRQIYPKSFTPESPPSAQHQGGTQPPALGFCPSGAHYSMGEKNLRNPPSLYPSPLILGGSEKLPLAQAATETGPSHGTLGFGVYWVTQPLPRGAQGWPEKPPQTPSPPPQPRWLSGHSPAQPWERPPPGRATSTPGQVSPAGGACPAPHLLLTNFLVTALGLRRRRPAPSAASRRCRCAARLCTSFSAKGDAPAR